MSTSLHVAITVEQYWHQVPGGTATSVWEMAHALSERHLEMTGVSAMHKEKPPARFRSQMPIEWLPLPRTVLYEAWHRLRAPKVQFATGPVDVIHATTLAIPPKSAPLVVTIHDLAFLRSPEHFTARGNRFFQRGLALALKDADVVVVPSEASAADCLAHGFSADRVRVVPWGVDQNVASDASVDDVKRRFGLESYILWSGTIEPRKNLPRLVEAFRTMETDLTLALAGPEGWNEDLDRLIGPDRGRIVPLGFVAPDDLQALYRGAAAFCYPSLFEGFGLPVVEAMAQGTPVVTSRGTATEEAAGGAAVLVDPTDVASIAEGITIALGARAELSSQGIERARTLPWSTCAQKIHAIYSEVAR
jgi:glycosyltransferase involved in cell wall biosynthesis